DYDVVNRMLDVRENGTTHLADYSYDALSRRKSLVYGNGARTSYTYAANDDLQDLTQQFNPSSSVDMSYTHNRVHQPTASSVSDRLFQFTPSANVSTAYAANAVDQYTTVAAVPYAYDGNGNLTQDGV